MRLDFEVPNEHSAYAGHFPRQTIVPAALLLAWIDERLREVDLIAAGLKSCKFLSLVVPGDVGTLVIEARGGTAVTTLIVAGETKLRADFLLCES